MTRRGENIALGLLKAAAAAKPLGAAGQLAKGIKGIVRGAANTGGDVAHALGVNETAGKALGVGALGAAGYVGYRRGKQKLDNAKFQLLYGNQQQYY